MYSNPYKDILFVKHSRMRLPLIIMNMCYRVEHALCRQHLTIYRDWCNIHMDAYVMVTCHHRLFRVRQAVESNSKSDTTNQNVDTKDHNETERIPKNKFRTYVRDTMTFILLHSHWQSRVILCNKNLPVNCPFVRKLTFVNEIHYIQNRQQNSVDTKIQSN
jgi:hypothetical protein